MATTTEDLTMNDHDLDEYNEEMLDDVVDDTITAEDLETDFLEQEKKTNGVDAEVTLESQSKPEVTKQEIFANSEASKPEIAEVKVPEVKTENGVSIKPIEQVVTKPAPSKPEISAVKVEAQKPMVPPKSESKRMISLVRDKKKPGSAPPVPAVPKPVESTKKTDVQSVDKSAATLTPRVQDTQVESSKNEINSKPASSEAPEMALGSVPSTGVQEIKEPPTSTPTGISEVKSTAPGVTVTPAPTTTVPSSPLKEAPKHSASGISSASSFVDNDVDSQKRLKPNMEFLMRLLNSTQVFNTRILPYLQENQQDVDSLPTDEIEEALKQSTDSILKMIDKFRKTEGTLLIRSIAKKYGLKVKILEDEDSDEEDSSQRSSRLSAPQTNLKRTRSPSPARSPQRSSSPRPTKRVQGAIGYDPGMFQGNA